MDDLLLAPDMEQIPSKKILLNLGGLLDMITGEWCTGKYGESILLGGLGGITGFVGPGNTFKTTLLNGMLLRGMGVVFDSCKRPEKKSQRKLKRYRTSKMDYDTETNVQESRLSVLGAAVNELFMQYLFSPRQQLWKVTDKTVMWGNEFFDKLKEYCRYKRKNAKGFLVETPFLDRDGKTHLFIILPTFGMIDSLTDFQTENEEKMMDENELGESGGNMLFAKGGLFKTRLLTELPYVAGGSSHFLGMTAQLNKEMNMGGGGPGGAAQPAKKLQFLGQDQRIVGATSKFTYATTISFNATRAVPLVDKDRMAEYVHPSGQRNPRDTDLMRIPLTVIRNKNGPTGVEITLLATQKGGFDPSLTELHNIRESNRFGIAGSGQWYTLALYPEGKMQRTTARRMILEDKRLRNALHYTSEMQQMSVLMPDVWEKYKIDPAELRAVLEQKGYDMQMLLDCRTMYRFNNDCHPVPFLSTLDLLKMAKDEYFPYWMTPDKKGIKEEFKYEYEDEDYDKITNEFLTDLTAKADAEYEAAKKTKQEANLFEELTM